tara:strand:- start:12725 stop:14257 length:1533 start_codon:yes stop_codon:yes gene_type:complete
MKKVLFSFVTLLSISTFAQDSIAINFANTINVEDLKEHLYILATDSLEGRETGQKGQKLAADYIARHFESIGIAPYNGETYYQDFPLLSQTLFNSSLTISKEFNFLEEYYTFPFFGSTSLDFESIQCIGFGIDENDCSDYRSIDVKDKVVLIFAIDLLREKEKSKIANIETIDWEYQLEKAYQHGAKAVFFVDKNVKNKLKKYSAYFKKEKRNSLINNAKFKLPFAFIDAEDLDNTLAISTKKLLKKVGRCKYPSFKVIGSFSTIVKENLLQGENVLGYLEGSDLKEELLVITAHYDHLGIHNGVIHNGADDDGSGTVAILELAEAFAKAKAAGSGPRRSILFMPVAGEEMGLLGSSYYAENPIFPLENTIADLNIDMIGRMDDKHEGNPDYVYLIGADKLSTELHQISEDANTYYTQLELDYTFNDPEDPNRFYYRSDHYNFAKNNIPVIFYFNGVHADYHKSSDTVDKIHFGKIASISKLIFHTAWQLVNQNKRIEVDVQSNFKNDRK